MRHVSLPLVLLLCVVSPSLAQDSRADLFGGYSYLNIDTNGLSPRQNANGWEASLSGYFTKLFAAEASVSGYYKSYDITGISVGVSDYSYVAGPRLNFKPIFIHALLGGDHLSAGALGVSASQDGFAGAFGGGVQWKIAHAVSFRASADYVFTRHNILGGSSVTQNNFRTSVGLVYSFGRLRNSGTEPSQSTSRLSGTAIPSLGITAVPADSGGAKIEDATAGGAAAQAGLHSDDVINSVNGQQIRTPSELAAAFSGIAAGTKVRVGYLINGQWQTETTIVVGNP